jgi:hypothetical protein
MDVAIEVRSEISAYVLVECPVPFTPGWVGGLV